MTLGEVMEAEPGTLSFSATSIYIYKYTNSNKTDLVLFSRKYKIKTFRLLRLDGIELSLFSEIEYLGVVLDSKLNWKRNTEKRMKKGQKGGILQRQKGIPIFTDGLKLELNFTSG